MNNPGSAPRSLRTNEPLEPYSVGRSWTPAWRLALPGPCQPWNWSSPARSRRRSAG